MSIYVNYIFLWEFNISTQLIYNDIEFSDILTKSLEQKPIYTADNVEYLYDEYTVKIQAIFAKGLLPSVANETPAQTYAAIQGCLSKPRQKFIYTENGTTLLESPAGGASSDAKNGPLPSGVSVQMVSPGSYIVEFTITTWVYNCCDGVRTNPYVAHRWGEHVTIDDKDFRSTIVRKGVIYFTSDILAGASADDFRGLATLQCPIRPKCIRKSEYTLTEDNLQIQYTISDTEQYAMPPVGLTKFEAEYRQVNKGPAAVIAEIVVKVWGANGTSKNVLFGAAAKIATGRLAIDSNILFGKGGKTIMQGYTLDKLHENYVELKISLITSTSEKCFYGLALPFVAVDGNADEIDPSEENDYGPVINLPGGNPDPGAYATMGLLGIIMVQPVLSDPCLDNLLNTYNLKTQPTEYGLRSVSNSGSTLKVVSYLPQETTSLVSEQLVNGAYINSELTISYQKDQHVIQMPVASSTLTASSFAFLSQPTLKKIVIYTIEKTGEQPTLPATISSDPNEILLWSDINPNAVQLETDNIQLTYKVSGKYIYAIADPANYIMHAGKNPYINVTYDQTVLSESAFVTGLTSQGITNYQLTTVS